MITFDILLTILKDPTTRFFICIIGVIFLAGFLGRLFRKRTNKIIAILPNVAVSIGILGTFYGVFIGLLNFDVSKINDSIPKLLEGLKLAFTTSIAGLIASIILKFVFEFKATLEDSKNNVQQDDPVELLKEIVSGINSLEKSSREVEKSIVSCFRSDEEYSLISQLKLIRQEIIDTKREMSDSFENFAEKIAESNTDALIKALEKVINEFNVKLNELTNESFKNLSAAMIKLTEWQENYKTYIDQTEDKINTLLNQMSQTVTVLNDTSERISKIDNNLENIDSTLSGISVSAEDISNHLESLKLQNEVLKETITSIKQIGEEAKRVLPTINEQLNNLTDKLETSVLKVTKKLESNSSVVTDFVNDSTKDIQKAVDSYTEKIQSSIEDIDKGLEEELSKALNSLAGSLASLSAKFVEDYEPLTERLREIVKLSEKIDA
ncbi:MAG: MotA/TolQ/ExbB proton channel family protein [Deltaproteobacteria bacterium]|nr:MotA/TolQ/ExbB proton channel family protein [Deltaproteobacteria bacterium]